MICFLYFYSVAHSYDLSFELLFFGELVMHEQEY